MPAINNLNVAGCRRVLLSHYSMYTQCTHIYQTVDMAHNVLSPQVGSRPSHAIRALFNYFILGCASTPPPGASIGHKSFKCSGLPSFRLDLTRLGLLRLWGRGNYSICVPATNLPAGKQILLCNPRHFTCFSGVERLTYVNDKSVRKGEGGGTRAAYNVAYKMAHKMATSVRFAARIV